MKIQTGDMWSAYNKADLFLFSSSGSVINGRLLMDGMMAESVYERFKRHNIDEVLGKAIMETGTLDTSGSYYSFCLLVSKRWPDAKLGVLQSRLHHLHPGNMNWIRLSLLRLEAWATTHPDAQIHMTWPGVGIGGIPHYETLKWLEPLPDNVTIWTLDKWWQRQPHMMHEYDNWQQIKDLENFIGDPDDFFYGSGKRYAE